MNNIRIFDNDIYFMEVLDDILVTNPELFMSI